MSSFCGLSRLNTAQPCRPKEPRMPIQQLQCEVTASQTGRLDQVVRSLTGRSWSDVRGLIHHGCAKVNGELCTDSSVEVPAGALVTVRHDPQSKYHEPPRERASPAFRVVFEDEDLIVVDKAAAVLTVPTDHHETNTLLGALNQYLSRRRRRAGVVHRLDRGTSGLLVFGKDERIADALQAQFRVRKAEREYAVIIAGKLEQSQGTFATRLGTTKSLQRHSVGDDDPGEDAITHYRVERRLRDTTYVRANLETGKRNQIRVHFAEAAHPVLGDERYRPELATHPAWKAKRLALHAAVLGFEHPTTRQKLRFESPLPVEFERFLTSQRTPVR